MNRLLTVVVTAAIFFAAGWFGSRSYYEPPAPEPHMETIWHGGACEPGMHHLVLPTPDGEKVLLCGSSLDDVVATLGPPHQQHVVATSAGQRTLLFYYADTEKQEAPRAWLALANDKLLAAYALSDAAAEHSPKPAAE